MNEKELKEEIIELFQDLDLLEIIIRKNIVSARELENELVKTKKISQRTIYRRLKKYVSKGVVFEKKNNGIKKNAQFIFVSTPKLKILFQKLLKWLTNLIFDESKLKNNNTSNLGLINEISSIFKNIILPEIKDSYEDIISDDNLDSFLNFMSKRVDLILDNLKIKNLMSQKDLKIKILESS